MSKTKSQVEVVIDDFKKKINELVFKRKKRLWKTGETWRYRISKVNMIKKFGGEDWQRALKEEGLYIGHFTKDGKTIYFSDTTYFVTRQDSIEILPFKGLNIDQYEYIMLGVIDEKGKRPLINPLGLVKTRPLKN